MKKLSAVIICIAIFFLLTISAYADCGPKPSLRVNVIGAGEQKYYLTLVTSGNHVPTSVEVWNENYEDNSYYKNAEPEEQLAFRKIAKYCNDSGFNFFGRLWKTGEQLLWSYYPPDDFTLLAYFPESDSFAISPECSCYAFSSYFSADISDRENGVIIVRNSFQYGKEAFDFLFRLIFTIVVELVVALIFCYWEKKTLLFFAVVNLVTQVALNIALTLVNIRYGLLLFLIAYFFAEILIVTIEALIYALNLPKYSKHHTGTVRAVFYAITANISSFILGVIITIFQKI